MADSSGFEAEDEEDFCLEAARARKESVRARKESVRYGFETARSATEALTRSPARVRFGGASDSLHATIDSEREASGSLTDSSITASGSTGPPPEKLAVDPHTSESGGRPPSVRRKFRTLTFGRRYKTKASAKENPKKRTRAPWNFKFKYRLKRCGLGFPASDIPELSNGGDTCVCTSYRRTEDHHLGAGVVFQADAAAASSAEAPSGDGKASRSKGRRLSQTATSGDPRNRCAAAGSQGSCGALDEHADDEERVQIIRRLESSESLVECVRITPGLLLWRASGSAAGGTGSASLTTGSASGGAGSASGGGRAPNLPAIDLSRFNPDEYPVEDWEERAFLERARELEEGVDPPPGYRPSSGCRLPVGNSGGGGDLASAFQHRLTVGAQYPPPLPPRDQGPLPQQAGGGGPWDPALSTETHLISQFARVTSQGAFIQRTVHTQVDYIHCLVPDLLEITSCTFYWGKMDRYEAEKLLENKPEGTFLLRDSAQEEYLFSVSFRRYSRSLHARIEQWNHKFSFDSHDPGVFASDTVCGLIEHYKDPSCCMFFEPMLTIPLHRTFTFPLQHLCRAVICRASSYDGVHQLALPKRLKAYLKEYHYKQRVRVRRFEMEQ